ncbi:MAG: bifunctional oligoribonuclease/PAP phosphatase NrnA [Thermoleophilia bacterium]|nr:bifunctional oligoribonuclease/PAP phosphatase NrnA [Thermoleophilia bacterium]
MTTALDLSAAAALLRAHARVLVACHEAPDGDALGSLVGLGLSLRNAGWDVVLWAPGDSPLPDDYRWLGLDEAKRLPPADASERLLVTVDCGSAERLGSDGPATVATASASINLDHHGDNTCFAGVNVVDANSPCATILVLHLLRALDLPITLEVAEALYVGIVTDTGRFMYANASAESHRVAAELIELGVDPAQIFRRLYEGKPASRVQLQARILSSLELRLDGRLAVAYVTLADLDATNASEADAEGVIDALRSIAGVEVAALVGAPRSGEGRVHKCSLRSAQPHVDVARIAHAGGGGGHTLAAGFAVEGSAADVVVLIERELRGA